MCDEIKTNPVRLRSKCVVIVYKNTSLTCKEFKEKLSETFKIKNDADWKYLIKEEKSSKKYTTIFLQFKDPCDIYTNNFNYDDNARPYIWSFSEKSYPLHTLLKFNTKKDVDSNVPLRKSVILRIMTNMTAPELEPYLF